MVNEFESAASSNPYQAPASSSAVTITHDVDSEGIASALRKTRPWVMFLGILGFIGTGLMLLGGVGLTIVGLAGMGPGGPPTIAMGGMYALMAFIYIAPSLYLVRYANRIRDFLAAPSNAGLELALTAQKSFWKFVGILMVVMMGFYVIVLVGALVIGFLRTTL